jgi:hypothetical protein
LIALTLPDNLKLESLSPVLGGPCFFAPSTKPTGVEDVVTLSAHRSSEFGKSYGVLISGGPFDHCLARGIFVVNDAGILTHVEYVKEIAEHPDYDAALAAAQA